jgi:FAD synthase
VKRLRDQRTFPGVEPLVKQMAEDVEQTRALLAPRLA